MAELLNELATFSAFTLSVHNGLLCGVTLMRPKKPTTVATFITRPTYDHPGGPLDVSGTPPQKAIHNLGRLALR